MVLPRIKRYKETKDIFSANLVFDKECDLADKAYRLLGVFSPAMICEKGSAPNICFEKEEFTAVGAYRLTVSSTAIRVTYGDYEGVRNAMATLVQLKEDGGIRCAEIYDYPDNGFRSCLLDLARGYVEIPVLKEHLTRMALLKCSHIHLHLMDRQSYILESDVVPNPGGHRLYSKAEMREIIGFCKLLSLEVIPEIEVPAHAVNLLKALPALECDIIDMQSAVDATTGLPYPKKHEFIDTERNISLWAVCVGNELTYQTYEKIIKEIVELFDGPYLHIGGDELECRSIGAIPHWNNCRCCLRKMQEEGLSDNTELYYYAIRRIYDIIKPYGKKIIMWNDQIKTDRPIDLPRDIIVEFWYSDNGGIYQKLLDAGFETINANVLYTYADLPEYMQAKKIEHWDTHTDRVGEMPLNGKIMGGEMCAWELGNPEFGFYAYTLPVCMALFADRAWNDASVAYDDAYRKAVFSACIGTDDAIADPLALFDEMIPPRSRGKNIQESMDVKKLDTAEVKKALCDLKKIDTHRVYGKFALLAYITCLEQIEEAL